MIRIKNDFDSYESEGVVYYVIKMKNDSDLYYIMGQREVTVNYRYV